MKFALIILIGYLMGSIPSALIIGKVFYKTDVRQHGSHNLGGGNTGRVLGKKAGVSVMTLDILKVAFVVLLAIRIVGTDIGIICRSLAAGIGHCYPVWARFKGGKAVATMYGYLFGLFVFASYSPWVFFLPLITFMIVLYFTKIVSLSSMISAIVVTVFMFIISDSLPISIALAIFALLIIVRHRKNIERMLKHEENKVTWI